MGKYTFGKLLYRFRKERRLEMNKICEGLCSESTLKLFEKEKNIPDILLFERMLERMGVSPEDVSLMVREEDYGYHAWQEQVCEAIQNGKWEELNMLLHSKAGTGIYCNERLEKQFFAYADGVRKGVNKEYGKAVQLLSYAAKQTMPDIFEMLEKNVLLSTLEIHILILYLYYGIMGDVLEADEGKALFTALEQYLFSGKGDINERAKCYPKLICIGLHLFQNSFKDREQLALCKKAIDMLRESNSFHDVTELLRLYIPLLEKRESRELGFYKKQYEAFCDLLESEGFDTGFQPECLNRSKPKVYILQEYLLAKRMEKGMTQEELSEGICTPETYSRIEAGKRTPKPKNFKTLAEKLEITGYWAQVLCEQGKYDEGILLCETVMKQMQHSKLGFEQQWNGFGFVLRILSCLYFDIEDYEISVKIATYVNQLLIRRGDFDL